MGDTVILLLWQGLLTIVILLCTVLLSCTVLHAKSNTSSSTVDDGEDRTNYSTKSSSESSGPRMWHKPCYYQIAYMVKESNEAAKKWNELADRTLEMSINDLWSTYGPQGVVHTSTGKLTCDEKIITKELIQIARSAILHKEFKNYRKLGDAMLAVAFSLTDEKTGEQKWSEIVDFVHESISSNCLFLKELAIYLVQYRLFISQNTPIEMRSPKFAIGSLVFGLKDGFCADNLGRFLYRCLTDADESIRRSGMYLTLEYLREEQKFGYERIADQFEMLVPPAYEAMNSVTGEEWIQKYEQSHFELLLFFADGCPESLAPLLTKDRFDALTEYCIQEINNVRYDSPKKYARHLLSALCAEAPNLLPSERIPEIVRCVLKSKEDGYEIYELCVYGCFPLHKMISVLGDRDSMVIETVKELLRDDKTVKEGLEGLLAIGWACCEDDKNIAVTLEMAMPFLNHSESHNLCEAMQVIRNIFEYCEQFPLSEETHNEIIATLTRLREDNASEKGYVKERLDKTLALVIDWPRPETAYSISDIDLSSLDTAIESSVDERSSHDNNPKPDEIHKDCDETEMTDEAERGQRPQRNRRPVDRLEVNPKMKTYERKK